MWCLLGCYFCTSKLFSALFPKCFFFFFYLLDSSFWKSKSVINPKYNFTFRMGDSRNHKRGTANNIPLIITDNNLPNTSTRHTSRHPPAKRLWEMYQMVQYPLYFHPTKRHLFHFLLRKILGLLAAIQIVNVAKLINLSYHIKKKNALSFTNPMFMSVLTLCAIWICL